MEILQKILRLFKRQSNLLLFTSSIVLSSCSTYSTKFNCADSKGLPCTMLREVDKKIDSGEINKAYKVRCKGSKCTEEALNEVVKPKHKPIKAIKSDFTEEEDVIIVDEQSRGEVTPINRNKQ